MFFCFIAHYCLYFCSRRYIYYFAFYLCCFGGGGVSHVFCYVCKTHLVLKYPAVCYCRSSLVVQTSVRAEFSECESFSSHGVTVKPEIIFFTELSFAVFS